MIIDFFSPLGPMYLICKWKKKLNKKNAVRVVACIKKIILNNFFVIIVFIAHYI